MSRTAILSNEKYRGVRLYLEENNLKVMANNPEQEEAEENIAVEYSGSAMEVALTLAIWWMCSLCLMKSAYKLP